MPRIPCAFSCSQDFLELVDQRAESLGMTRSQYIVQVIRQDLLTGQRNLSIVAEQAAVYGGKITNSGKHKKNRGARTRGKRK